MTGKPKKQIVNFVANLIIEKGILVLSLYLMTYLNLVKIYSKRKLK